MSYLISGFTSFTALSNRFHAYSDKLRELGYSSVGGNKLLKAFAELDGYSSIEPLKAAMDASSPSFETIVRNQEFLESIRSQESGDVRSLLDELIPSPATKDVADITEFLRHLMPDFEFGFTEDDGWYYDDL
ncbi:hypothetical protein [Neptuniibacter sp. QD37_11]|uniref:hypothetical protein n=1 Tax=Neptuniibacter sp. QD37_11 TaxID=3398209 RepID=UPI0039F62F11